ALGAVSRRRDLPHGAHPQLRRRRAARHLRPAQGDVGVTDVTTRTQSTTPPATGERLLDIRGLQTDFATDDGIVRAVNGVDLALDRGETLGVVGESGSGKSVTALSVLKLIPMPPGRITAGKILWRGRDLVPLGAREMREIRSKEIAVVFQEPMTSL